MLVTYIGNTSIKLIKGEIYKADSLFLTNINSTPRRKITLQNITSSYFVENFETVDGLSLYTVDLFNDRKDLKIKTIDKLDGQYIRCKNEYNSKYLKKNEVYLVKTMSKGRIILNGIKTPQQICCFEKIKISEQRKIKLQKLNGGDVSDGLSKRKFLLYSEVEQKRIILELFIAVIKRIELKKDNKMKWVDILSYFLLVGKKYDILESDIDKYLKKSLKSFLTF